jgi:hypothetical protein
VNHTCPARASVMGPDPRPGQRIMPGTHLWFGHDRPAGRVCACLGAVQRSTTTRVPTSTRSNRSMTSSLNIRMQPYDAKVLIEAGRLVPWIAY